MPIESLLPLGLVIIAYMLGSISSAIITCRLMGLPDPRGEGSGNPGATNVLRIAGKKAAAVVLLGDVLKGFIPTLLALLLGLAPLWIAAVGVAAFLGHLYPLYFGFMGGKGVATLIGVLLGMNWILGLASIATWLFVVKVMKISSLSALVMAALTPFYGWFIYQDWRITAILTYIAIILFWRHRSNIQKLIHGEEDRLNESEEKAATTD